MKIIFNKIIKPILNIVKKIVSTVISSLSFSIAYFSGIGPTWITSKLFRKRFLNNNFKKSSFISAKSEIDLKKMY